MSISWRVPRLKQLKLMSVIFVVILTLKALGRAAADDILTFSFLFFRENKTWHIEIPNHIFSEK